MKSEEVEQCLRIAGWHPGRQVDTKPYEEYFLANGFPVFPNVMEFLSEYGNLKFFFEFHSVSDRLIARDYIFDPMFHT